MKKFDSINVIPFIDIMLVLLAIVLATASFINQGKIEVKVPQSNSQTSVQQSDMAHLITINEKGEFFYQDEPVSIEELSEKLKALQKEDKITIKIDAQTAFQQFVQVTDILTTFKLDKVTVVTEKTASAVPKATP